MAAGYWFWGFLSNVSRVVRLPGTMGTPISQFDYELPPEFIAQSSVEPRDHSKLMLLDRASGEVCHKHFYDIVDELKAGDVLVFNVSKVFRARLRSDEFEVFVLKVRDGEVDALVRPGKKVKDVVELPDLSLKLVRRTDDGVFTFATGKTAMEMFAYCDAHGEIPTPPYVSSTVDEDQKYQTVYARETGSVAAPTAGFHFTNELLGRIRAKGVQIEEVILHVGIGTFRPVQTEIVEEHTMHSEWVSLSADVAGRLNAAKQEGRRVIAVGTTTVRALEGVVATTGDLGAFEGELNIFITPGFAFKVIDGLVTNFHLPKSTLLMLVSALAGRENVLAAYEEAKRHGYRFFSFGDAMFVSGRT